VGMGKKTQHGRGDERFSFIKLETGVSNVIHLELPWKRGVSLRDMKYHSNNARWGSYNKWRCSWWRLISYDFQLSKDWTNGRETAWTILFQEMAHKKYAFVRWWKKVRDNYAWRCSVFEVDYLAFPKLTVRLHCPCGQRYV
jgi:hypothetical protein